MQCQFIEFSGITELYILVVLLHNVETGSRRVTFLSPIIEATSLHTYKCKEKAVKCTVKSCSRIVKHRDIEEHITEEATSHHRLQAGEIQQLHQLIYGKV